LLLARTYSGVPLGPSSDWFGDGIGLLTKEKVQNESDEGASSLRQKMQRLPLKPESCGFRGGSLCAISNHSLFTTARISSETTLICSTDRPTQTM
jgi:hypothetical protein